MLRAVTDVFTWALVAGAGAFAVMILFSRLSTVFKIGGLVVAIGLALTFRILMQSSGVLPSWVVLY